MSSDRDQRRGQRDAPEFDAPSKVSPGKVTKVEAELLGLRRRDARDLAPGKRSATQSMRPPRSAGPPRAAADLIRAAFAASEARPLADPEAWSTKVGSDVGHAEVAHGPAAAAAAAALDARAFTVGHRVFFGAGYDEATDDGELLAHELTHVAQQHGQSVPQDAEHLDVLDHDDPREVAARGNHVGPASEAAIARDTTKPGAAPTAPKPIAAEPSLLAVLRTPVVEGDERSAQHRKQALLGALAAVPEKDRLTLLTRLSKPATNDELAHLFKSNLAEATRKAALDVLRNRVAAVDEKTLPAALQPFVDAIQSERLVQIPAAPVIDGAWKTEVYVTIHCPGDPPPSEIPVELHWSVVDRAGDPVHAGVAPWFPGSREAMPITVGLRQAGRYSVSIDVVARGLIAKRLDHVLDLGEVGSGAAAETLAGEDDRSRAAGRQPKGGGELGKAADAMSDAKVTQQAGALRERLKAFDGQSGAQLAQNPSYQRTRRALDELEWQASTRITDEKPLDTHAPGTEADATTGDVKPLTSIRDLHPKTRGEVRTQVEAMVRRYGLSGARREISAARTLATPHPMGRAPAMPVLPDPSLFRDYDEELDAFEASNKVPDGFAVTARRTALDMLQKSEQQVQSEIKRYGIAQTTDHRIGPGAYQNATGRPNAELQAMAAELKKLAELKKRTLGPEPGSLEPRTSSDEHDALQAEYELALQAAVIKFPSIYVFAETARQQGTPRIWEPERIAGDGKNLAGPLGWELNQKLLDIRQAREKIENDDERLNVWCLPRVIEMTKRAYRVGPGTLTSAVIDDHIRNANEGGWTERLLQVVSFALGLLLMVPTEGASLAVAAANVTLFATDLYLLEGIASRNSANRSLSNTALDPARALIAEEPQAAELLLALVTLYPGATAAVRSVREVQEAAAAVRSLRRALTVAAGDLTHAEVVASRAMVRRLALKAFKNDAARAEAYVDGLIANFGKRAAKVAVAVERGAKVAEYGTEALATRLGISKITVVEDLKSAAQVRHAVEDGRLVVAEVRVGPTTTVAELMDHVGTVEAIERYNGLTGRLRRTWDRLVEKVSGTRRVNPFLADPNSPGFKIFEEVRKHESMLRSRMRQLASAIDRGDARARGLLQDEISFYEGEAAYWNRQAQEAETGRGVAGRDGIEARRPVDIHNEAIGKGYPKLPENQRYRRTGSSAPGKEYEPYTLQSRESAGQDILDEFAERQRLGTRDPVPEAGMHEADVSEDLAKRRHEEASVRGPSGVAQGPRSLLARHIPPPGPEFDAWFDGLTLQELDTLLADPSAYDTIAANIRHPGGLHEWIMVKHARKAKEWGVSMELVRSARTRTEETVGRYFKHGGAGSTTMHGQLSDMIVDARTFEDFKRRLNAWADDALFPVPGTQWPDAGRLGRYYLPPDLQIPPEGVRAP